MDATSKEYKALLDKKAALDQLAQDKAGEQKNEAARATNLDTQRAVEDARLDLIQNALERELQMSLTKNQREFDDAVRTTGLIGADYDALVAKKTALDQLAKDRRQKVIDEDLTATAAWAKKTSLLIADQYQKVPELVRQAALQSRQALTGETETFLTDLMQHNEDLGKSLNDLSQTLGKNWAHIFAQILTNGESVTGQIEKMYKSINVKADQGGAGGLLDAGLSGAGLGSFVGGVFGGPNNYGGIGGTVGGGIGAIIGAIPGGITAAAGAAIGAALGTAIGSMIQKGTDMIKIAMSGVTLDSLRGPSQVTNLPNDTIYHPLGGTGTIDVNEKGISAQAREDLFIQVKRKTKEALKSWQDILDLLPQNLRDELAKMPAPTVTLNGGVTEGDIRDENALQSLQDFLGDKMPKAVFSAYHDSIQKALTLMGVNTARSADLFAEWGTLTGQELHDAVQRFFKAAIEGNDWRGKIGGSRVDAANAALGMTEQTKLQDINSQIALTTASMSKLTDINDLIAAQETLNGLSKQYYDESLAATEQLIDEQKQLHNQNQSLVEQVKLAGMGDQQKIDYFYGQLATLRDQLKMETDPKKIAEIEGKMNSYVQSALGLAPDNAENRDKLLGILADIEQIRDARLADAQGKIVDQNEKAATMLQNAATALLGAADALKPPDPNPNPNPDPGGGPGTDKPKPDPGDVPNANSTSDVTNFGNALRLVTDDLRHLHDWAIAEDGHPVGYLPIPTPSVHDEEARYTRIASQVASAVRDALDDVEFTGTMRTELDVNTDGLVDVAAAAAVQEVKLQMRRNPDSFISRNGR
jgi:hypothetical protein